MYALDANGQKHTFTEIHVPPVAARKVDTEKNTVAICDGSLNYKIQTAFIC